MTLKVLSKMIISICFFPVGVNMPVIAAMAAMTSLTMFGVAFIALRNRLPHASYLPTEE